MRQGNGCFVNSKRPDLNPILEAESAYCMCNMLIISILCFRSSTLHGVFVSIDGFVFVLFPGVLQEVCVKWLFENAHRLVLKEL